MRLRRRYLVPLLALSLAILLFFHRLAFSGLIFGRGDTLLYFYPYWQAAARSLFEAGRIPLWNSSLFMGAPFLANSQAGLLYPLNWLFWALLPAPYAVSGSILLHLLIAGWGAYLAARRCYGVSVTGALPAGLLYALGGYLTAQVEHVNQLQGLAWLPWYFAAWGDGSAFAGDRRSRLRLALMWSGIAALQFLAGHTQSLFISLIGFSTWLLATVLLTESEGNRRVAWSRGAMALLALVVSLALALGLAAAQLLPTLELTQLSSRQGGLPLNEALSFSLNPLLLAQSLLPSYGQALFSEYIAFLPITALLLAVIGAWAWRDNRRMVIPLLVLALLGLSFALGRFNPFYVLLAHLPGFDLFRAPARWLALYALALAFLAAIGWQRVQIGRIDRRALWVGPAMIVLLILWGGLAPRLAASLPIAGDFPIAAPTLWTWAGRLLELALALFLLLLWPRIAQRRSSLQAPATLVLALVVLFLASRSLPYNHLTTPAAFFELRPTPARLMAYSDCRFYPESCGQPPGRVLSLSEIFFDLGDQTEIEGAYAGRLPESALFDYLVATKHKEVLSPNLPLTYDLASVDGFDGGILPLQAYTQLMSATLQVDSSDGRLREYLDAIPEARWLDMFNSQYLVTDKVGDEWHEGVFFDRQHPVELAPGDGAAVGYIPAYEATELWLLVAGGEGNVHLGISGGQTQEVTPEQVAGKVWRVRFPQPMIPAMLEMQASENGPGWQIEGLALVDSRDGTFQPLVPGNYRLLLSGDVKMYENLDVLPRAYVVHSWSWQPDTQAAVNYLGSATFDPRREAVIAGEGEAVSLASDDADSVSFERYEPEQAWLSVSTGEPGLLVLSDAYYPGWTATIDGNEAEILQVNGLFRGLFVPAGQHEVRFEFAPSAFANGRLVSAAALMIWVILVWMARRRQ